MQHSFADGFLRDACANFWPRCRVRNLWKRTTLVQNAVGNRNCTAMQWTTEHNREKLCLYKPWKFLGTANNEILICAKTNMPHWKTPVMICSVIKGVLEDRYFLGFTFRLHRRSLFLHFLTLDCVHFRYPSRMHEWVDCILIFRSCSSWPADPNCPGVQRKAL
jgi:hypothetical protein